MHASSDDSRVREPGCGLLVGPPVRSDVSQSSGRCIGVRPFRPLPGVAPLPASCRYPANGAREESRRRGQRLSCRVFRDCRRWREDARTKRRQVSTQGRDQGVCVQHPRDVGKRAVKVRTDVVERDVDDEQVQHTHHVRQSERCENDAGMPVLVLNGCRCSRSHNSAVRDQDHAAAQVAGIGAFLGHRGVGQTPALAGVCAHLAGGDEGCDLRHRPATRRRCPGCGRAGLSRRPSGLVSERCREW